MQLNISREELQDYNQNGKGKGKDMITYILDKRKGKQVDTEPVVKTEREEVMEALDDLGIEYKKNQSTKSLKELLVKEA